MPRISISAYVPASPAAVYTHVTAFPAQGTPDNRLLEAKYGYLESQENLTTYTFRETGAAANRWLYTFDPPFSRHAQALDSNWSNRTDVFEASGDGTTWTITWEPQAQSRGAPFILRWLFFRWKDRQRLYGQIMQPVVDHFQRQDYY